MAQHRACGPARRVTSCTAHASEETAAAEARAADRIFGILPADLCSSLRLLWDEFEAAVTLNFGCAEVDQSSRIGIGHGTHAVYNST